MRAFFAVVQYLLRSRANRCPSKIKGGCGHPRPAGAREGTAEVDEAIGYGLRFVLGVGLLLLLLFITFSVWVANPKKLPYTVANPARGLLTREKRTKEKLWQHPPPPSPDPLVCSFELSEIKITRRI